MQNACTAGPVGAIDFNHVEHMIQLSISQSYQKLEATQYLDTLRVSPDRWNFGLKLFFEGKTQLAQFFGLSLVREFLSCIRPTDASSEHIRKVIREGIMSWINGALVSSIPTPAYILNNVVSVLTQSLKNDYPELWPSAFTDVFSLGGLPGQASGLGLAGADVAVRLLKELDFEVIMFHEARTKDEIAHNVVIKDRMREYNVVGEVVVFLCRWALHAETETVCGGGQQDSSSADSFSSRCLFCLADFIGWIDVQLVVNHGLQIIYQLLSHANTRAGACACLFELVKKGMDTATKLSLMQTIGIVPLLASITLTVSPLVSTATAASGTVSSTTSPPIPPPIPRRQRSRSMDSISSAGGSSSSVGCGGLSPLQQQQIQQLALVVDMTAQELLACCTFKGDDATDGSATIIGYDGQPITPAIVASMVSSMLPVLMPRVFELFQTTFTGSFSAVLPACNKLVSLLKQQEKIATDPTAQHTLVFRAEQYLDPLLFAIYRQLQYPVDLDLDSAEDEEPELMEAKRDVRKLFVNCCRVYPSRCLDLISAVLAAQPMPLSTAPFPQLDSALRLVHAFSECGSAHSRIVNEGSFPELIATIHQTDIAEHSNPHIVLSYFEISLRYLKLVDLQYTHAVATSLLGPKGLASSNSHVQNRCAYFMFKLAEALEGKSSLLLTAAEGQFAARLVGVVKKMVDSVSMQINNKAQDTAEIHLFEALGLITSSTVSPASSEHLADQQHAYQLHILRELAGMVVIQVQSLADSLDNATLMDQVTALVAHRINCLSSLAKGHRYRNRVKSAWEGVGTLATDAAAAAVPDGSLTLESMNSPTTEFASSSDGSEEVFEAAASSLLGCAAVTRLVPRSSAVRTRSVMLLHRMLLSVAPRRVLQLACAVVPTLLANAEALDMEDTVQLLNQLMIECAQAATPVIDVCLEITLAKYKTFIEAYEITAGAQMEAPHIEGERSALCKQLMNFLQHVCTWRCQHVLCTNSQRVEILHNTILPSIISCLTGAGPVIAGRLSPAAAPSRLSSLPLRKSSLGMLTGLVKAWLYDVAEGSDGALAGHTGGSAIDFSPPPPPTELRVIFRDFLFGQALRSVMFSVTPSTSAVSVSLDTSAVKERMASSSQATGPYSVNVRDAAAQGVLTDTAGVLWTLFGGGSSSNLLLGGTINPTVLVPFFQNMLSGADGLNWPPAATMAILQQLEANSPLGTYQNNFRSLIREGAKVASPSK